MPHFADPKFQQIMSGRVSEHLHLVTVKTRRLPTDSLSASFGTGKPESQNGKIKKLMKFPPQSTLKKRSNSRILLNSYGKAVKHLPDFDSGWNMSKIPNTHDHPR